MNKKISVVLIFTLLFVNLFSVSNVFADESNESNQINIIRDMGLMDSPFQDDFLEDKEVLRKEAVKYVLNLINIKDYGENKDTYFKDVSKYNDSFPEISAALSLNIIKGDINGNFRPDDKITYNEAYAMILRAMGYENKMGEYDSYFSVANKIGLLKNIKTKGNFVTRGQFANLLYNTFDIGIVEQKGFGDKNKFEIDPLKTTLFYHNMRKGEGVVSSNDISSIYYSDTPSSFNTVRINEDEYLYYNNDIKNLLGYNVEYYYEYKDSYDKPYKIKYFYKKNNKEENYKLYKDSFNETKNGIEYIDENNKSTVINIEKDSLMLLNGKSVPLDLSYIINNSDNGEFKIISHKNSSYPDIILLNTFVDDIIFGINAEKEIIYLKNTAVNGKRSIEFPDKFSERKITIYKDNILSTLDNLKVKDSISYSIDKEGKIITIKASSKKISGVITGKDKDKIFIDNKEYNISNNINPNLKFDLKDEITAYLTYDNKIIDIEGIDQKHYGYLLKSGYEKGVEPKGILKIFTDDNKTESYKLADKVSLNKGEFLPHSTVISEVTKNRDNKELFSFELNKNNEIININFPKVSTGNELMDQDLFIKNHTVTTPSLYTGHTLDGIILKNAVIFEVPDIDNLSEEDCKASTGALIRQEVYPVKGSSIKIYDIGLDGSAKVALSLAKSSDNYKVDPEVPYLVTKVVNAVDNNGMECKKLYLSSNGNTLGIFVSEDAKCVQLTNPDAVGSVPENPVVSIDNLKYGDIISFETDREGKISLYSVVYQHSSQKDVNGIINYAGGGVGNSRSYFMLKGDTRYISENTLVLEYTLNGRLAFEPFEISSDSEITIVNTERKSIRREPLSRLITKNFASDVPGDNIIVVANRNKFGGAWLYE